MSDWKTKQYEIKLKVSDKDIEILQDLTSDMKFLGNKEIPLLKKIRQAFHKEVIRQEKEKDIKNRIKK